MPGSLRVASADFESWGGSLVLALAPGLVPSLALAFAARSVSTRRVSSSFLERQFCAQDCALRYGFFYTPDTSVNHGVVDEESVDNTVAHHLREFSPALAAHRENDGEECA